MIGRGPEADLEDSLTSQPETVPLPAPFWVHSSVDRPTLPGSGGSDPLWHCWCGKPTRDPKVKRLLLIRHGTLIYRKSCGALTAAPMEFIIFSARIANPMEWQP
jgi:hypothetical protein